MSEPAPLELEGLCHGFDAEPVFADVTLSIRPGEFAAALGASGCGKTTLLRCIAGLATPRAGRIRIAGRTVAEDGRERVAAEQRRVGLVFQDYALFPHQTVRQNIAFGLAARDAGRVDALLELIGMRELAEREPGELSGGQQQRVAIARALAPGPGLLLLDEPFANVDATLRQRLGEELQMIVRSQGTSALLVTHDRSEALALADRVAVLCPGPRGSQVVQYDTPERVYHRPATRECAALAGHAAFLPGEATGAEAKTALGTVALSETIHGKVEVVLRPENVEFAADASGPAEVVARLFQGRGYRVLCRTPSGDILAESHSAAAPALGARGRLEVRDACWALPV